MSEFSIAARIPLAVNSHIEGPDGDLVITARFRIPAYSKCPQMWPTHTDLAHRVHMMFLMYSEGLKRHDSD